MKKAVVERSLIPPSRFLAKSHSHHSEEAILHIITKGKDMEGENLNSNLCLSDSIDTGPYCYQPYLSENTACCSWWFRA